MKEMMSQQSELKNVIVSFRQYNINKLKYVYVNSKKEIITEIVLKEKDFKNKLK